jgi:starvation-inducible DNA-binding protein
MKKQIGVPAPLEPEIGIQHLDRSISIDILNKILADEFVLLVQTLNYHWNLVGPEFHDYHKLFDHQYKAIFGYIDDIAERVRSVGGIALGSMNDYIKFSQIKEDLGDIPTPKDMVYNLLLSHEILIRHLRDGINKTAEKNRDMGTSNFLTDLIEKHEKIAWMLRSLLERR